MMQEIIKDFFIKKLKEKQQISYKEVERILDQSELNTYISDWKNKMYMKLLEIYSKN